MVRKLRNLELNRLSVDEFKDSTKWPVVVVLDNVRSMSNVGSVFRTCDAFNVQEIYLCGITPTPPHREISKTAIGAELAVNWKYASTVESVVISLKQEGWKVIGVEQTTSSLSLEDWLPHDDEKIALIFGHEIDGISDTVIPHCDHFIAIPQFGTKHSLNVAVCAGIVMWQAIQNQLNRIPDGA